MNLWRTKIFAKLILSRLPISYRLWSKMGLFRHGTMDDYSYAWTVLKKHSSVLKNNRAWRGLELGPGDGLLSAFLAPAVGSTGLTLVDAGDFAHKDWNLYKKQITQFLSVYPSLDVADFSKVRDIDVILKSSGSSYHTEGLMSLRLQKKNSFDLIYSQAVLEHIRLHEFKETMNECYQLLKPNGVMSHVVDFKDHLGGRLNNMRFPSALWEKAWFAQNSGFYTNRIRLKEMISICENIGFNVEVRDAQYWDLLPINRSKLAVEFKNFSNEELLVSGAHLVMTCLK
jgi:SAM-dependent methyltransferase